MNAAEVQTSSLSSEFNNRSNHSLKDILIGGSNGLVNYTCMSCNKIVNDIELHLKEEHNINRFHVVDEADNDRVTTFNVHVSPAHMQTEFFDDDVDDVLDCVALSEFGDCYMDEVDYRVIVRNDKRFFMCKNCESTFENLVDLKDHSILRHDNIIEQYDCQHCIKMFPSHKKLIEHIREEHNENIGQKKIEQGNLELNIENDGNFRMLSCPDCNKLFRFKSSLVSHRKQMHSTKESVNEENNKAPFHCAECNLNFSGIRDLKRHRNDGHGHRMFSCVSCDTTFPSRGSLNLHNIYHHRVHRCSSCNLTFSGRLALTAHVKQRHPGMPIYRANSRFVCEYCSQPFSIRTQLSDHIQSVHLGLINQCEDCGKVLATAETLKVHRLKHKPEMHRTCEHCGRQFYRTGMLTEHIRACHPEALPDDWRQNTTCPYCQSHFTRRESMRRHIEAKHEPKSLSCSFCERQFTCRRYLIRHENKHHLGRPAP